MKVKCLLSLHKPIDKNEKIILRNVESLEIIEELNLSQSSKYNDNNVDRFYCINGVIEVLVYI